jgi:hypothetical protein
MNVDVFSGTSYSVKSVRAVLALDRNSTLMKEE